MFLGYAAGVGKTYQMLVEAHKLKADGVDVVVGYFEPHGRADTIALSEGLEIIPRRTVEYRGARFEEMDTDAVLRRRPRRRRRRRVPAHQRARLAEAKRWEDVHELLDAGIDVLTTMNVQHLESLNDQIWQSTGVRVRETIPDWVLKQADEVVMVDLTPRALLNRLARGVVYPPERARAALENFFKEPTLVALRELAMRQAAYVVESRLPGEDPMRQPRDPANRRAGATAAAGRSRTVERRPDPARAARGRLPARRLPGRVRVEDARPAAPATAAERERLERHLNFARGLQIETRVLEGDDVAETAGEVRAPARRHPDLRPA